VLAIAGIFLGLWLASSLYFWLISKDALRAFENPNSPVNNAPSSETRTAINSKGFTNNVGIEFVWIPPGRFMMGSERDDEKPPHWVTISNGFYMGKYEVTQEEWERVMGIMKSVGGPMYFYGCSRCPVESTTWDEAIAFINKLNARNDGYIYELPSEAKWEYACRASTKGGDGTDFKSVAWYADNSGSELLDATNIWETDNDHYYDRLKSNLEKTHVVGTRKPNAFGLFDMQGNVWEWCADRANDSYEGGPPLDGSAWVKGQEGARIRRGGSFISPVDMLRCATRVRDPAGRRENDIGFRVVAVERQ
jgi:formylglycine-generating enzyme required for sulfatase activity